MCQGFDPLIDSDAHICASTTVQLRVHNIYSFCIHVFVIIQEIEYTLTCCCICTYTHTNCYYSLDSPTSSHHSSSRDRSISNDSFKMDPVDIERIVHPSSDQMYTVVNRVTKPNDQIPKPLMKHHSTSTPDVTERPGSSNSDRRQDGGVSKYPSSSNISVAKGRPHGAGGGPPVACPRYPPPPPPNKKPPQQSRQPLNYNNNDEHDYSDPADDLSSPSPDPLSPLHLLSPTSIAPSHSKMHVPSHQRSKEDLFSGVAIGGGREQSKPKLAAKPVPRKKPMGLVVMGRPETQPGVRMNSPPSERPPSPFRSPLRPPTSPKQKSQLSQVSPEPPKQQPPPPPPSSIAATNAKPRHRPSYAEIDPDQEIKVEPISPRLSATDNDMWVKVKYSSRHFHYDSLGRRSSSSSNLTNTMNSASGSENYSNLAELTIDLPAGGGSTSGSNTQRRHSFTGGDENMLIIKASAANR